MLPCQQAAGGAQGMWKGTQPEQLTQTGQRDNPHHRVSCGTIHLGKLASVVVLWLFLLSVFHIRTSCRTVGVKELLFWFHATTFWGTLGSPGGEKGRHTRRSWREEDLRWSSGLDTSRSVPLASSAHFKEGHVFLLHFGYSSLSF